METKFATAIYELGHLFCGHLGPNGQKWLTDRRGLDIKQREYEDESVCWLVCGRMGIKNPSAQYLNGYLKENEYISSISIDTVLKSAGTIESLIKNGFKQRKEIIVQVVKYEQQKLKL